MVWCLQWPFCNSGEFTVAKVGISFCNFVLFHYAINTFNRPTAIMGLIVNFIVGGFIAILFYYAIKKLGQDYLVFKGLVAGLFFWVVFELIFTATIEGRFIDIRPVNDYYAHIFGASIFGITLGFLFNKYLFKRAIPFSNQ